MRYWIQLVESLLIEGRDAPLYHWMDGFKAINVLKNDKLEARVLHDIPGLGTDVKGISLSRNKRFTFLGSSQIRLTLDQSKLSQKYKFIPLDGEAAFRRRHELPSTVTDRGGQDEGMRFAEEYLLERDIMELHKYVAEIFIQNVSSYHDRQLVELVKKYAGLWDIPLKSKESIVV